MVSYTLQVPACCLQCVTDLIETPSKPWPPHCRLGTSSTSRTRRVLLLQTNIFTGFSTLAFRSSFSVSLSWFQIKHQYINIVAFNYSQQLHNVHSIQDVHYAVYSCQLQNRQTSPGTLYLSNKCFIFIYNCIICQEISSALK